MYYSVALLEVLVWPVLLFFVALLFYQPLKDLLGRLTKLLIKVCGLEATFLDPHEPPSEKPLEQGRSLHISDSSAMLFDPNKPASAFWLGSDLMWTIDVILRGAPKGLILRGLKHSLHHFSSLGLIKEPDGVLLTKLIREMDEMRDKDINTQVRNDYAKDLNQVIGRTAEYAKAHQPNFDPGFR